MKLFPKQDKSILVRIILAFIVSIVITVNSSLLVAQTWNTPVFLETPIGTGGETGLHTNLQVVNGNPAIVYLDGSHNNFVYIRATDSSGTNWSTQVILDMDGGMYPSLQIVKGFPAVSYYVQATGELRYVCATDSSGNSWGTPIAIDVTWDVGLYTSMRIVEGMPAISYYDATNKDLKYVRANDSAGTTWGTPIVVESAGTVGMYTSLEVINGYPAISYKENSSNTAKNLKYVRATDATGSNWGAPKIIEFIGNQGLYTSLKIVKGLPVIAYQGLGGVLRYVRSTDPSGNGWGTPLTIDAANSTGHYPTIQIVNGYPAISYYTTSGVDLKYIYSNDSIGSTWGSPVLVDITGNVGEYASFQVVNGLPAISYHDQTNKNLKYIRATDIVGNIWGASISFDGGPNTGACTSLQIVKGIPAVAYNDVTNGNLKYVLAQDSLGASWGTSITIDSIGSVGNDISMQIVNGMPAICHFDATNSDLKYIRALDSLGLSWGSSIVVDQAGGRYLSLLIVNGMPAISYYDSQNKDLKYVRALDNSGSTWATPVIIDATGDVGLFSSLEMVSGNPAISYYDNTGKNLKYVRAIDASGASWSTPITIDVAGDVGAYPSLEVVNGNPAISYADNTNYDLKYVRGTTPTGSAWASPVIVDDTNDVGSMSCLKVINGNPAISYYWGGFIPNDGTYKKLRYVSSADVSGNSWNTPVILDYSRRNGEFSSMIAAPCGVGIAYYNEYEGLPSFIFKSHETLLTVQPSDSTICATNSATFGIGASGGILTYQWQVDQGGGYANLTNTSPYSNVTTATMTLTNAITSMSGYKYRCLVNSNCSPTVISDSAILTVNGSPLPAVTANASVSSLCQGDTVVLTGGGAVFYSWSSGATNGVGFAPATTITYTVTGTDTNSCNNTATVTVIVNNLPVITATASATNICPGLPVTLTGGGAVSYSWSNNVTNGIAFIPSATTTYTVTGTDANGCINIATKTITVSPTVTANANNTEICFGMPVTLTGGGAVSYVWTGGVINGTSFAPPATSTYTVTGTAGNGCTDTASITITVNQPPIVTANASETNVCGGTTVTLTGSGAVSYTWTGGVSNGIGFVPIATKKYTVTGTDVNGCTDTASVTVTVTTWSAPTLVETLVGTGGHTGLYTSMTTVNGKPAISYYDQTRHHLMFVRALDASGGSWNSPVVVADVGLHSSLMVVNGMPAIAYYRSSSLRYIRALDSIGNNWGTPIILDSAFNVGDYNSLQIVNGNPAISYYDRDNKNLKYIRALDGVGSSWGAPVIVDSQGEVGEYSSLLVVNGNPAISYFDYTNLRLKYKRSADVDGNAWGASVVVDASPDVGRYNSMKIVNGNPAIAYSDDNNSDVKYVRAANASGSSWGNPVIADGTSIPGMVGQYMSLEVVNGNPAISYRDFQLANDYLKYVRANDVLGNTWNTPVVIQYNAGTGKYNSLQIINGNPAVSYYDEANGNLRYKRSGDISGNTWSNNGIAIDVTGDVGQFASVQNVKGKPAIAYYDYTNSKLRYKRALDTTGTVWGNPVIINTTGNGGSMNSLQIVNNNPAIAYFGGNSDLYFVRSFDSLGNSWNNPIIVDNSGQVGTHASLLVVNGNPAIAYYDLTNGNLKFVRATDASGSGWGTPITIDNSINSVGHYCSLQIINGVPAIAYYDLSVGMLQYIRATNVNGSSWATPIDIGQFGTQPSNISLQNVKGKPAIAFYKSSDNDLLYIRANDASGSFWGGAVMVDNSVYEIGLYASMRIVEGMPAISYYDKTNGNLVYKRALDSLGSTWSTPMAVAVAENVGQYTSMYSTSKGVGIAYYNATRKLPSFTYWNFSIELISQPLSTAVCSGNDATFTVVASCGGLNYQWQIDDGSGFVDLNDSSYYTNTNTPNLFIAGVSPALNSYKYRCRVTGMYSDVAISNAAVLEVDTTSNLIVYANATSTSVCPGTSVTLTSAGTGVLYAWSGGVSEGTPFVPDSTTTYFLIGTTLAGGCSDTASITINVSNIQVVVNASDTVVCAGSQVVLNASGATSYNWTGGITNGVSFLPASTDTYTVIGSDINGCLDTVSQTITVNALPSLVITDPGTICSPNTVNITDASTTFGSSIGTYNYWHDSLASVAIDSLYSAAIDTSGTYYIKLSANGCADIKPIIVTIDTDCVWPGDANKDSVVNNYDLLPIGLFYSQTGIPRSTISNTWQAFASADWNTAQINGADIKHIDCDGDGSINNNDTLAVNLNYSLMHAIGAHNYSEFKSLDPELHFVTSSNSYYSGDWIDIEIWAGSNTKPVTNLYGIAFDISYDASLVQPGTVSLTYPNSWLGFPGADAIKIARIDELSEKAYGGISRIDHSNENGFGKIAHLKFQSRISITSVADLYLSFSRYKANEKNGLPVTFNLFADSITIFPLTTGIGALNGKQEISILPNPFNSYTTIAFSNEQQNTSITIFDVFGKQIKKSNFSGRQFRIEREGMNAGVYFIQIEGQNYIDNKRIVIE